MFQVRYFRLGRIALITTATAVAFAVSLAWHGNAEPPSCNDATIHFSTDYSWMIASASYGHASADTESDSTFRWQVNGTSVGIGVVGETLLLPFDSNPVSRNGELPVVARGLEYVKGRWGTALALNPAGVLRYARAKNLSLSEGTVEMWVALRVDGASPVYATRWQVLWQYYVSENDWMAISQAHETGVLYAGGMVRGQWQSAYSARANMTNWAAGEWHHLAYTYSASNNFMRFYLDGDLVADSNVGHYWSPSTGASSFTIGSNHQGAVAQYLIDEVRISKNIATSEEIAARAARLDQPRANEVWKDTTSLQTGDQVTVEFTPGNSSEIGAPCVATLVFPGVPLTDPNPPTTLLRPGTTSLRLSVTSIIDTTCRYAIGSPLGFDRMTPFESNTGGTLHQTTLSGLSTNANVINHVYVRCAAFPDFLLHLKYRCLSSVNPPFPRKVNLWGWYGVVGKGLAYMSRIDFWLTSGEIPGEVIQGLRLLNPHVQVLTSINAVEHPGLPDDFYLKDVHGKRIEVWPGYYRLNLTKRYVAEYQAKFAYESWLKTDCQADGVYFDNAFTSQSWVTRDMYGDEVQIDADENGIADSRDEFDSKWKQGVFAEFEAFRAKMPYAIMAGNALDLNEPAITNFFNGITIGFQTADIIEGQQSFDVGKNNYLWWNNLRAPHYPMILSQAIDELAYGYGYEPWNNAPSGTWAFARDFHPWMRFGLAYTLLGDGYFAHEWGDVDHGSDWWYDELNFNLGYPLGPATLAAPTSPGTSQIINGGFETSIQSEWYSWADTANGYSAVSRRVTDTAAEGTACARIDVTRTGGEAWRVAFYQENRALTAGQTYEVVFSAKASKPTSIAVGAQKGVPDWRNYGLWENVRVTTEWTQYAVSFTATESATDARLLFSVGSTVGTVWLDDIRLHTRGPDLYRREFENGLVLLNASPKPQFIDVGKGFRRITGRRPLGTSTYLMTLTRHSVPLENGTSLTWIAASGRQVGHSFMIGVSVATSQPPLARLLGGH